MTNEQKISKVLTLLKNRKIVVFDSNESNIDRFTVVHHKHYQADGYQYGLYVACSRDNGFYQHGEFDDFISFVKNLQSSEGFTRLPSTTDFREVFSVGTFLNFYDSFIGDDTV